MLEPFSREVESKIEGVQKGVWNWCYGSADACANYPGLFGKMVFRPHIYIQALSFRSVNVTNKNLVLGV